MIRLRIAALMVLVAGLSPFAAAASGPEDVSSGSKWYMHIHMSRLVESALGQRLLERRDLGPESQTVRRIEHWAGFNPLTDVNEVLVFHHSFDDPNAVIVLYGSFSPEGIGERAELADDYEAIEVAGRAGHRFQMRTRRGEQRAHAVVDESWLAISGDRAALAEAVEVLAGERAGVGAGATLLAPRVDGALVEAGAMDFHGMHDRHSELIEAVEVLHVVVAEADRGVDLRTRLVAVGQAEAIQLTDMLRGFKALAQLRQDQDTRLARALEALRIERDGNQVNVRLTGSIEDVIQWMDRASDAWEHWRR